MAVSKIRKMSSWTLYAIILISAVVFGLFFFGGNEEVTLVERQITPIYTSLLLYWCYAAIALAIVLLIAFSIFQFAVSLQTNPKGAFMGLGVILVFAVLVIVFYAIGSDTPIQGLQESSQPYNVPFWLKSTDMWIYSIYFFVVICLLAGVGGSIMKIFDK